MDSTLKTSIFRKLLLKLAFIFNLHWLYMGDSEEPASATTKESLESCDLLLKVGRCRLTLSNLRCKRLQLIA
jgi:hypothetical protein